VVYERTAFIEIARGAGVRAPKTQVLTDLGQLRSWIKENRLPAVLKANGTCGGDGVRVVRNFEEAERAFRALQAPPSPLRAVKRALADRDRTLILPAARRRRFRVNAQEFMAGREATSAVACWQGKILASLHFEVLNKRDAAGPSSVLRRIQNADMSFAAETMVRALQLSGLHGFDFMLDPATGEAFLIEINPRATQVGHLTLGAGHDLPAALYAAVTGQPVQPAAKLTDKEVIALFPQEWMRDPASPFLQSGYHDVPWDEPELLRACAGSRKEPLAFHLQPTSAQALSPVRLPRV
jgi:carbamoylphosphate synthase large subunit